MSQALLTLAATVVGGALVLLGDHVARRSQWDRQLRLLLREAGEIEAVQSSLNAMSAALLADDERWVVASTACLDAVVAFTNALRTEVGSLR